MNSRDGSVARRLRILFEDMVDLEPSERAARLARLDPSDPVVARIVRLLDAHDHARETLAALEFLRQPDAVAHMDSSFDAAAAFAPRYTIEGELDGGGMSRLFFGRDAKLGRTIVAKVLPPELGAEVKLGRFQQEITLAAQLRHPHIVPLLESAKLGVRESGDQRHSPAVSTARQGVMSRGVVRTRRSRQRSLAACRPVERQQGEDRPDGREGR